MQEEPPEGYYAFVESPNAEPPKVKSPPYVESDKECHGKKLFYLIFKFFTSSINRFGIYFS